MEDLLRSDRSFVLPNDMLRKLDRMSMASGLEARVPFLDQRAVRLVESFPSEWRIDKKERKILLKRAFGDLLPERVMKRPKQGFEVPLADLLRRTYRRELRRYADFGLLNEQAIFDPGGVERSIGELEAGKSPDNGASVWAFLVFQKWWEKWLA
jgi:asparagine synthase (glutamine-hydrolysing)